MPFEKGQSGNPGGRPKADVRVKELARAHTEAAIETLVKSLGAENEGTRVSAAEALLNRGWGKPAQAIVGGDENDNPIRVITEIRRSIVDPKEAA